MRAYFFFCAFLLSLQTAFGFRSVQEGVFVRDIEKIYLKDLSSDSSLTVDHIRRDGFTVYGPKGLRQNLVLRGIPYFEMESRKSIGEYPSYDEYTKHLKSIHEKYPKWTSLFSIGKSVQGRDLWVMKISDRPEVDQVEPEVKYISSMHGDEITGRESMVALIEKILSAYGSGDVEMKRLVDNTEIFIMPSMNPDGSMVPRRGNAHWADLNRDFPDFSVAGDVNAAEGREPETQAVMKFQGERHFALSANFHGGAEVVNYMWDTAPEPHPFEHLLKTIALRYAQDASYIGDSPEFDHGITNGYAWYEVDGGMQDWSYYWYGDLQFTIELSNQKWPPYSEMGKFYQENEKALINFLRNVHQGAGFYFKRPGIFGGVVIKKKDESGEWKSLGSYSFSGSEFYKVLEPGLYSFEVLADLEFPKTFEIEVADQTIYSKGNFKPLE